ncbi:helicase [Putridiphycobacter roseus]|uniref:Helicase n=1 Tax=Putridiphycobacter roseus TaxID=2219161 RepID=A0A2W1N2Q0_9FLAO|nr:PIF1 family DEAD/DEAH box helicase [Putridiphycobacter roseus]PZE17810.1 helicase [Putridiphycobacter roseus]
MTQELALDILKSGRNVFLTGSAGTGKTYVLNQFIQYLNKYKISSGVTASTGIAATHIKGQTIHSWVGMGIKNQMTRKDLHFLSLNKALLKKIEKTKVLIIDEISMLHLNQLNLVDQILQYLKDNLLPFGGIQIVLCGDFFQLPPIGQPFEKSRDKFAFMSTAWVNAAFNICYLTQQFRQDKNVLSEVLGAIRNASVDKDIEAHLKKKLGEKQLENPPIQLYTHNADVDRINEEELDKIEEKVKYFWAKTHGKKELIVTLKKSVIVPERLSLKLGAKVMFVKNNPDKGYINGTLGKIIEFSELGLPVVRIAGKKEIIASPEEWSIDDDKGTSLASFLQIPLRLAWAITVHKSQGMTLDSATLDLSKTFEKGQGYVALSRLKSLEKMNLLGFNATALSIEPLAVKADKRFKELSAELAEKVDPADLKTEMEAFKIKAKALKFIK